MNSKQATEGITQLLDRGYTVGPWPEIDDQPTMIAPSGERLALSDAMSREGLI